MSANHPQQHQLVVRLLGPFQVELGGQIITNFESDKVRALLSYLAAEPGILHRREFLVGLLWPDRPEDAARANLRHILANLRKTLQDYDADPHYLLVTRQAIGFNPESRAVVDVLAFRKLLANQAHAAVDVPRLEAAADLYRGSFLEGFSVGESVIFEEWALLTREVFSQEVMSTLRRLSQYYESQNDYEGSIRCLQRQVSLEPWNEDIHQALIRLLANAGRYADAMRQYRVCAQILEKELGVLPTQSTRLLIEQIQARRSQQETVQKKALPARPVSQLPAFLQVDVSPGVEEQSVFVSRDRELSQLAALLRTAQAGNGQFFFVIGGPGRGKTALLKEFARRAMGTTPNLLVASGVCNAFSGPGDPYLPFRQILEMLTGDLDARWLSGVLTHAHARTLWRGAPNALQALVHQGPYLVDTLLPFAPLLARAQKMAADKPDWLLQLESLIYQDRGDLQQTSLLESYVNVLHSLALQQPLLLIIDDLQWVDQGSVSLLFFLLHRLQHSRIMVLGAYRPEEVAFGRNGSTHPLEPLLLEMKQRADHSWLDLSTTSEADAQGFVNAILDTIPNQFDADFRKTFFQHTEGYPLFTIELLHGMQSRGDLVQDDHGRWLPGPALSWAHLPGRVEAAIAARIDRLGSELRGLLDVACVEGERFTAQVLASVEDRQLRKVLRMLNRALGAHHRLVRPVGEIQAGEQYVSRFQFAHPMYQTYLYHSLSPGERRLLHADVAHALETLYSSDDTPVLFELAHHYREGGVLPKGTAYLHRAGQQALARYATEEALNYFSQALDLAVEVNPELSFAIRLDRVGIWHLRGSRANQLIDLDALTSLSEALQNPALQAQAALQWAIYFEAIGDFAGSARAAQRAVTLAQAAGSALYEVQGCRRWGYALLRQGFYNAARQHFDLALDLAQAAGIHQERGFILGYLGELSIQLGYLRQGVVLFEQALTIAQEAGDRRQTAQWLRQLGETAYTRGHFGKMISYYEQALTAAREINDRRMEGSCWSSLGAASQALGQSVQALEYFDRALTIAQEVGDSRLQAACYQIMGEIHTRLKNLDQARICFEAGLAVARASEDARAEGWLLAALGDTFRQLGQSAAAIVYLEQSLEVAQLSGDRAQEGQRLGSIGLLYRQTGEFDRALKGLNLALEIALEVADRHSEAAWKAALGSTFLILGQYTQAQDLIRQAQEIAIEKQDKLTEGHLLNCFGKVACRLGETAEALSYFQQALNIFRDFYAAEQTGFCLCDLGFLFIEMGRWSEAVEVFQEAQQISTEGGGMEFLPLVQAGLGRCALETGALETAQTMAEAVQNCLVVRNCLDPQYVFLLYSLCCQILQVCQPSQVAPLLEQAHTRLQSWAANIADADTRRTFLENIPVHDNIARIYQDQSASV